MCKAADVEPVGFENTAGYICVLVEGDVGACKTAVVEAGIKSSLKNWNQKFTARLLQDPTEDLKNFSQYDGKTTLYRIINRFETRKEKGEMQMNIDYDLLSIQGSSYPGGGTWLAADAGDLPRKSWVGSRKHGGRNRKHAKKSWP